MNNQFIRAIFRSDELDGQFYASIKRCRSIKKAGGEFLDQLENRIITYWSLQSYAHYLFGLGLRQEILDAFMEF